MPQIEIEYPHGTDIEEVNDPSVDEEKEWDQHQKQQQQQQDELNKSSHSNDDNDFSDEDKINN